jgi:iron complex outermembrane receptor protein
MMAFIDKRVPAVIVGCLLATPAPRTVLAQTASLPQGGAGLQTRPYSQGQQAVGPIVMPPVIVTAQKEPADAQKLPVSLTIVSATTLRNDGITLVSDAAGYAPNTYFSELTARKVSNARFRGIGSSPANPGITTYFDAVPQLNANSSSIELMDVDQVEFVRGPQSALFGRNSLGGLINITTTRPSLMNWTGSVSAPLGNNAARDVRGSASGPLVNGRLGAGVTLGYGRRDGFTRNDVTGHDLDSRSAFFGKGQLLWTPTSIWEARLIVTGERARDGDYALNDLDALRQNPFHVTRDFEGHTDRDVLATTVLTRREGARIALSTTTGFVRWTTDDATDLDYSRLPLVTRDNKEEDFQFTQEVRFASAASAPVTLSDQATLRWQSGVFVFTQHYDQDAVNEFSPFLISPLLGFPVSQHSPLSALDDFGVGIYGQATTTFRDRLDVSVGARMDHENKEANLRTFFSPAIAPDNLVTAEKDFFNVSPQVALAWRARPDRTVYVSTSRGFKAGGFNPASPRGAEAYDEEHTWLVEGGLKASWADGRVSANTAAFFTDWQDLQLNLPNPAVPAQFYIANVGGAASRGVEVELSARPHPSIDLFGTLGYTHARFKDGSVSSGVDVSDKKLPNTPDYTATVGTQVSRAVRPAATIYGRAEVSFYGAFRYDDANAAGQEAYSLANFRAGVRGKYVFGEAWVRNAFDTRYIPIAFPYPFAPSGFIGESGRPRTFGVTGGITF